MTKKRTTYNRRDFISKTTSKMASLGILGVTGNIFKSDNNEIAKQKTKGKIITRTLGKTGIRLPIVNMGVMNSMDPTLIKKSYEIGVRHFDTAAWYLRGRNEEMLGKAIKEMKVRDKVIIATKIYIPGPQRGMSTKEVKETYLKIADESLKRLQMDYVDILYSHSIKTIDWLNNPGILEALQILKKQKKARFIGFTTHSNMAECLNDAARSGFYDVISTTFNYAMCDNKKLLDATKNAASKGIGLISMKTQCTQYWYRQQYVPSTRKEYYKGRIMHTAVLKWVLQHPYITTSIPGYTTFQQMEEDFSVAYNLEYNSEEKRFLKDRNVKLSMASICQQCDRCIPSCPRGVEIPTLMRTHMYATCYSNFYQAKDTLNEIPKGMGLDACVLCDTCRASCVNQVDIASRIDELKTIYS